MIKTSASIHIFRAIIPILLLWGIATAAQAQTTTSGENLADKPWVKSTPIQNGQWHGFEVYEWQIDQFNLQIAVPAHPAEGNPWVISIGEIGDGYHWQITERLLQEGAYVAAVNSYDTYGSDKGLSLIDSLYFTARKRFSLPSRCGLYGVSRAGLSIYRWSIRNPERVACIYCEGPVLDFKTWPMCWPPSSANWTELKQYYGFASDSAAMAYPGNPIDNLAPIAAAEIPIRHVISLTDEHDTRIVPNDKNTLKAQKLLQEMGHDLEVVITPEGMKAPYAFDKESVGFMLRHTTPKP